MNIHFVLVEPTLPENIGASARAIKTMGFRFLRLVNPCDYLADKAQMLAHGSVDILKSARVFSSCKEALQDMDFIIGTTTKKRLAKNDYYLCSELPDLIAKKSGTVKNVAVMFGRESRGLNNTELRFCDNISYIPMKKAYPSLNLGQTVMLYAYSLSSLALNMPKRKPRGVDRSEFRILKQSAEHIMKAVKVKPLIYGRVLERMGKLGDDDIRFLLSMCNMLSKHVRKK